MTQTLLTQIQTAAQQAESQNLAPIYLALADQIIQVNCNSALLHTTLTQYFDCVLAPPQTPHTTLQVVNSAQFMQAGLDWPNWPRPKGKAGLKETTLSLGKQGRLIFKIKTGMLFWQNPTQPLAIGPVDAHPNQIINFILTQNLNLHLQNNWLLGHCAGLSYNQQGIAIAGLSGGGKSTLMLHLLEQGQHFISNDRLLFKRQANGQVCMRGIAKQPRINPGTIVHNPKLQHLISEQAKQDYLALPNEVLRQLEHKFDAPVNDIFGANCYQLESPLHALIILNWQSNSNEPTKITRVDFATHPELIEAVLKSPGPFYSTPQGEFLSESLAVESALDPTAMMALFSNTPCWQLSGNLDFKAAVKLVKQALLLN